MQDHLINIWDTTLGLIRDELNGPTFATWFSNTAPQSLVDNEFVVGVPNQFAKQWLESRFLTVVEKCLTEVLGAPVHALFVVNDRTVVSTPKPRNDKSIATTSTGTFNPRYSFDSFVIGAGNRFAHAAALAVAEKPSHSYNPLFIYGGVGLGKTHLLQSIGQYVRRHNSHLRVKYVSSEKFTNDFINSIRDKGKIAGFQKRYRNNHVLLVDDIQFLENKEATQEEFFHTFNTLYEANKQIVLSSDRPPKDIATLEERLVTRFESGLIVDIQPPDIETRIAILRKKTQADNLKAPDEVLELIASRIQSNIRELHGALIRVVAYSSLTGEKVTVPLAEDVLRDIFPETNSRPITIVMIQSEVCKYYNITKAELVGNKRSQNIVLPRQIAMYISRELTDLSLPKIGQEFGNRDHTTVLHADNKIRKLLSEQRQIYNNVQEITNRVRQRC